MTVSASLAPRATILQSSYLFGRGSGNLRLLSFDAEVFFKTEIVRSGARPFLDWHSRFWLGV